MFVDLSVIINEQTPVYPGDPKIKIEKAGILEKDGYEDRVVTFGNHNGTHIDAPRHMIKGGKTLDQFSIEKFIGRGVLIKVARTFEVELVQNANIKKHDIVLFYTGVSGKYYQEEYFTKYPPITEEVAEYLVKKKIKMVGVDTCSVDYEPFPVHRILLKNEILIIENLTNLSVLEGKEFTIYAFPLKLNIDGAPARVIAEIL